MHKISTLYLSIGKAMKDNMGYVSIMASVEVIHYDMLGEKLYK